MRAYCSIKTAVTSSSAAQLAPWIMSGLPSGDYKDIFVKPNWVLHAQNPAFPISAMTTDPLLIEAVIDACITKYPSARSITVGDVPLQSCDWGTLRPQAGIDALERRYSDQGGPRVSFLDMRREFLQVRDGYVVGLLRLSGDPQGYREVELGDSSFLEPVSGATTRFRVSDYDPRVTVSSHRKHYHRYVISGSVLQADLFINVPKMKTHQKAGITGALKNIVGITGNKACLVHHRAGLPKRGGDEFPPDISPMIRLQVRWRNLLQGRSRAAFYGARMVWSALKGFTGLKTEGTRANLDGAFYLGSGSWYGNDTIWRMIYDLNRIILYAPPEGGGLRATPQRDYVCVLDGIVAGEGNGPLQPLPVRCGIVTLANDPFLADMVMARLMGFDRRMVPQLANADSFRDGRFGQFDPASISIDADGVDVKGIDALGLVHRFVPAPGWRGHIELERAS